MQCFLRELGGTPLILAHNLPFDKRMWQQTLAQIGEEFPSEWMLGDTLKLLRKMLPSIPHSISSLCEHFGIPKPDHRASNDIKALEKILEKVFGSSAEHVASSILEHWALC